MKTTWNIYVNILGHDRHVAPLRGAPSGQIARAPPTAK
jgi:hypothetical protein